MNICKKLAALLLILIIPVFTLSVPAQDAPKVIHVFVALCDNLHQGIVPVPPKLGNGDHPGNNLYWGAMYGVKTFFKRSSHWTSIKTVKSSPPVLERCIFKHRKKEVYLVADAYQGRRIKQAVIDFLDAASGKSKDKDFVSVKTNPRNIALKIHGDSHLIVYVGHDGLMDFTLENYPKKQNDRRRETIILACISKMYFHEAVVRAGAKPLLWTTGLMAPEAYTLESAIEGWVLGESAGSIRLRAAKAYNKYQKCGLKAAKRLLVSGM